MILAFIFIICIFTGASFYVGRRIFQALAFLFPNVNGIIYACIYIIIAVSFILDRLPLPSFIKGVAGWIGTYWTGLFFYLLLFFIASDLIVLIGSAVRLIPAGTLVNVRFYAGTVAILLSAGVVCYGVYNANKIIFVSYDVQLNERLPEKINIVFMADLHLGGIKSEKRIQGIVKGINSLKPDIVCIAGDIFTDDYYRVKNPGRASALLGSIEAKYGVYASLGNHDGGSTLNEMMDFLERSNIKLLNDEHIIIDERLILIGRLDSSPIGGFGELSRKDFSQVMAQADINLPVVVMDHNPGNMGEYGGEVDLILAGHTHRGQLFPGSLFTRLLFTADYGHYQKDPGSPHVIVTQGVGTWMIPMRVGTNNEIVSVVLR